MVSVEYFLDEMPLYLLNDIIEGINYKNRPLWEMTRVNSYLAAAPHCKRLDIKKMLPLPWDNESDKHDTAISDKDIERLKRLAKKFERQ